MVLHFKSMYKFRMLLSKKYLRKKNLFMTCLRNLLYFFLFTHYSGFLCERERMYKRKNKGRFLCESDCKDKNFIYYTPKLFGSFFVLFFKRNLAFSLCQFCKAFFSWKAGAKVHPFGIQSKYIKIFFRSFFERIC